MIKHLLNILFLIFVLTACWSENYDIEGQSEEGFEDGTYCADVTYYNPNTGTSNDYTLQVKVSNNDVIRIDFGNGGHLDSRHMDTETLNENGECKITSDRNYEYSIHITGRNCGHADNVNPETDEDLPRYTLESFIRVMELSNNEVNDLYDLGYYQNMLLTEDMFDSLFDYVQLMRVIKKDKENGEIIWASSRQKKNNVLCQLILVRKNGYNYLLFVNGNDALSLGTARFNEYDDDWQTVWIKNGPRETSQNGYFMRIIERGVSKVDMQDLFWDYCGII